MQKIITIIVALIFTGLATSAMADPGTARRTHDGYSVQGKRIERHLDAKGDRIQQQFHRKAVRAADRGRYQQAWHFEKKGRQINRHLDRRGDRMHQRFNHRGGYHGHRGPHYPYPPAGGHGPRYEYRGDRVGLIIQQPGFLFNARIYN